MITEDLKPRTPYKARPHNGAFLFLRMATQDEATEPAALMVRLGEDEYREFVPLSQISEPTPDMIHTGAPSWWTLATEAALTYKLEPGRIQRAAAIASKSGMIGNAKKDENGNPITPTANLKWVRGSKGCFYTVRQGFCTCEDHKNGNICKHRIAVWMHDEMYIRATAHGTSQPREKVAAIYYAPAELVEIEG